jgi:hypothetical protein
MCSTLRPAGAIVHGAARGEGVCYSASAASPPGPLDRRMPTANTDGTSVGTGSVGRGGGCEAAGGVHLPLPRLVVRERPKGFRPSLRRVPARARLLRVSVSAVRRSAAVPVFVLDGPVGAAEQQLRDVVGLAIVRGIVQRRGPARQTGGGNSAGALNGRFAASANGAPVVVLGVHVGVGIDERSDDSAIAVARRQLQRGVAIAVHGGAGSRGWAPRGSPSTQTGARKQNSTLAPRADYVVGLGNR